MLDLAAPVISDFIIGFQRNPAGVAEDSDLRKQLFSELFRHFDAQEVRFSMEKAAVDIAYYPERSKIRLNPVRTAYPAAEKFDIAILDPAALPTEGDRFEAYWQQPIAVAINLHFASDPDSAGKYLRKLDRDLGKMGAYREGLERGADFCGLSILLVAGAVPEGLSEEIEPLPQIGLHAWVAGADGLFQYEGL